MRQYPLTNQAFCAVSAGLSPTFIYNRGILTVTRVSAGVYDLTMDGGGIDAIDCNETVNVRSIVADASVTMQHTSDTVKRVTITTGAGATATDADFVLRFDRVPAF
jgi:hypothetical protein